jgi:hypothetical protein
MAMSSHLSGMTAEIKQSIAQQEVRRDLQTGNITYCSRYVDESFIAYFFFFLFLVGSTAQCEPSPPYLIFVFS